MDVPQRSVCNYEGRILHQYELSAVVYYFVITLSFCPPENPRPLAFVNCDVMRIVCD